MEKLDRNAIEKPRVQVESEALEQLRLIVANDFTVEGKSLRIFVSGKGCGGFDYGVGFDGVRDDDFVVSVEGLAVDVVVDPFCAYYLGHCRLDYVFDSAGDEEGFVVTSSGQDKFKGKFWRKDTSLVPPTLAGEGNS